MDLPHGRGIMTFTSGAVYEGDFVKGSFSGYGKMVDSNGSQYVGAERIFGLFFAELKAPSHSPAANPRACQPNSEHAGS